MPRTDSQRAFDTLLLALDQMPELAEQAKSIVFLRGQPHEALVPLRAKMECTQTYKPRHTLLEAAGFKVTQEPAGDRDLVLVLPDRQKDETHSDLAQGLDLLKPGGTLLVALHNDWGARRFQDHLFDAVGAGGVLTKNHCRAFWVTKPETMNEAVLNEWRSAATMRRILDGKYWSRPGLFSWNRIDDGSALLAPLLHGRLKGRVADLGCGWGYLSCEVLTHCPDVIGLDGYEADLEAVEVARRNFGNIPVPFRPRVHWHDVTRGVEDRHYDAVVMNPPFHEGREPDPMLGVKFINAAARGLKETGVLWLVANLHLPYEESLQQVFDVVEVEAQGFGFKVIRAAMPRHDLFFHRGLRKQRRGKR